MKSQNLFYNLTLALTQVMFIKMSIIAVSESP